MEKIDTYKLSNGMAVLGVPMAQVQSAAFDFMIPCGAAVLPDGCCGASAVIEDWIFRGAGGKTSRELTGLLDGLGLHRSSSIESKHITLSAAMEAENLDKAISLYADVILRPSLDNEQFEFSRQLAINELAGLDDDPRHKISILLREHFYPVPLGRNPQGRKEEMDNLSAERGRQIITENFDIPQTIFAVAGKYDFKKLCGQLEKLFGSEKPKAKKIITPKDQPLKYHHHAYDGSQVHIGIMTPTVPAKSSDYYNARVAVAVLSGGMSCRLFTEVREKRGLCYAIGAKYSSLKEMAGISCYSGTTPEKAQETYDVIIAELRKLGKGIGEDEMQRAKIGLESGLIMQSESTMARAAAAATDFYILGKVRTLDEIKQRIEKINVKSVLEFLNKNPFEKFCTTTIGPTEIKPV